VEEQPIEKEAKIEYKKFDTLIESLGEDLGDALLSSEIWSMEGEVVAGHNQRQTVCDVFTPITFYVNEALNAAEYPELGEYYILNLEGAKISVTIPLGNFFWGMLIDSKKNTAGIPVKSDSLRENRCLPGSRRIRRILIEKDIGGYVGFKKD
jgi:hypothetical protein